MQEFIAFDCHKRYTLGVYALIETILVRDLKRLTLTMVVLGLITIPSASLRFIDEAWVDHNVLGLEPGVTMPDNFSLGTARESSSSVETLISHVEGTPFYGFDLEGSNFSQAHSRESRGGFSVLVILVDFGPGFFVVPIQPKKGCNGTFYRGDLFPSIIMRHPLHRLAGGVFRIRQDAVEGSLAPAHRPDQLCHPARAV